MSIFLKTAVKLKGGASKRSFDRLTTCPEEAQNKVLLDIMRENQGTEYGKEKIFSEITNPEIFKQKVSLTTYSELMPYIERIKHGERNILTARQPQLFNLTSGTTTEPKYIPVTPRGMALTAGLSKQWLCRAQEDHRECLNNSILCISSASVEGITQSGIPYGSASGMMYKTLPSILHKSFALPFTLSEIKDYALRYYVMTRIAIEKEVSFVVTPNPTTLLKIAETGIQYQEEIVKSIHDGNLFSGWPHEIRKEDARILDSISVGLKPNKARAGFIQQGIDEYGKLLPQACWKGLKLIGCWLGGSVGFHANKLKQYFGEEVPMRDIGYLASEGSITIPYEDTTPAGILALQNNYYEFIPEDSEEESNGKTLKCHELEQGKRYKIILTNQNGLYRYNIHDVVEVYGFYNQTPLIAFVRKSGDMLNITGEKLHVNHFLRAFQKIKETHNVSVVQFKAVPNYEKQRYEILMHIQETKQREFLQEIILPYIDASLSGANIEYSEKRKSGRLKPPCIHIMKPSWEEDVRNNTESSKCRDVQNKWRMTGEELSELDAKNVLYTLGSE